ncbi:MAG: helix-turn-helix domain-containing protein [Candidatus Omnitrophota bacterium]
MNIGKSIARIRENRKISRKELAQKTSVPYQTLNNIEAGRVKEPGIAALIKIAQALEVSLDTLILNKLDKGLKNTIPNEVCKALQDTEVKKFFSLIDAVDVKGIKKLKKISKYFKVVIEGIEVRKNR